MKRAAAALIAAAAATAAAGEDWSGLPPGPGREATYLACSACHSARLIAQQALPRARWDALLDWMVEEQGMAPLDPETRATVLDYLSRTLGPQSRRASPFNPVRPLSQGADPG